MEIRTVSLDNSEIQQITHLYHEVWGGNHDNFFNRFKRHASYPGFHGVVAIEGNEVVGFAYGYTSTPGQFYYELLHKALSNTHQDCWLEDCFEFVELAVHPAFRRNKLGQELVEKLLENVPNKTAILTTQMNNTPARKLYEKLDWKIVQKQFIPGETTESYVIMGKRL